MYHQTQALGRGISSTLINEKHGGVLQRLSPTPAGYMTDFQLRETPGGSNNLRTPKNIKSRDKRVFEWQGTKPLLMEMEKNMDSGGRRRGQNAVGQGLRGQPRRGRCSLCSF